MERSFGLGDLELRGGEAFSASPFSNPAEREGLATTPLTADGLKHRPAGSDFVQLIFHRVLKPPEPHRHDVKAPGGDRSSPQGVDDLSTTRWADLDRHYAPTSIWNCSPSVGNDK